MELDADSDGSPRAALPSLRLAKDYLVGHTGHTAPRRSHLPPAEDPVVNELSAPFSKYLSARRQHGAPTALSVSSVLALPDFATLVYEAEEKAENKAGSDTVALHRSYSYLARLFQKLLERTPTEQLSADDLNLLRTSGTAALEGEIFERMAEANITTPAKGSSALGPGPGTEAPSGTAMTVWAAMPLVGPRRGSQRPSTAVDGPPPLLAPPPGGGNVLSAVPPAKPVGAGAGAMFFRRAQTASRDQREGEPALRGQQLMPLERQVWNARESIAPRAR